MKLKWEVGGQGFKSLLPEWVADGAMSSYQVLFLPLDGKYMVRKLRQPNGQIVASVFALTLDGAQARAQVWEDAE